MRGSIQEKEVKKLYNNDFLFLAFLTISLSLTHSLIHSLSRWFVLRLKLAHVQNFVYKG